MTAVRTDCTYYALPPQTIGQPVLILGSQSCPSPCYQNLLCLARQVLLSRRTAGCRFWSIEPPRKEPARSNARPHTRGGSRHDGQRVKVLGRIGSQLEMLNGRVHALTEAVRNLKKADDDREDEWDKDDEF